MHTIRGHFSLPVFEIALSSLFIANVAEAYAQDVGPEVRPLAKLALVLKINASLNSAQALVSQLVLVKL
ncbi:MAG: hypothetical protein ACI841_000421 [Planctomycetota bacterium]|jgi:hypothetical protein